MAGDGIHLTPWNEGVVFGLRPGTTSTLSWTAPGSDDAWLVLDRNGNGLVDDGSEMFGNVTRQAPLEPGEARNGYRALAVFDGNHDGIVDELDPVFGELRLWRDENHDARTQPEELTPLTAHGITGLGVEYAAAKTIDAHGNGFRYSGVVHTAPGSTVGATSWDVWLTGTQPVRVAAPNAHEGEAESAKMNELAPHAIESTSALLCDDGDDPVDINLFVTDYQNNPTYISLNENMWPYYRVCNTGSSAASSFHVRTQIYSYNTGQTVLDTTSSFSGVLAGQCKTRPAKTVYAPYAGSYLVTWTTDVNNTVSELNEYDNVTQFNFSVY